MLKKTIFAGFGGQGVLTMGYVLALAVMRDGKHVTYLPAYGAEVRGGTANCTIAVSDEEIASPVASSPDFAVLMNKPSMAKYEGLMRSGGAIILNSSLVDTHPARDDIDIIKIPANDLAQKLGSDRIVNMIMLGAYIAISQMTTLDSLMNALMEIVKGKKGSVMQLNRKGLDRGVEYALKGA
jgi:2-oxoglutarate ferredoxin oxidoreductase subunit gamma